MTIVVIIIVVIIIVIIVNIIIAVVVIVFVFVILRTSSVCFIINDTCTICTAHHWCMSCSAISCLWLILKDTLISMSSTNFKVKSRLDT